MRLAIATLAAVLQLAASPPGEAAPTCRDGGGQTVRCGTAGALPVGSALTPAQQAERRTRPGDLSLGALAGLVSVIGGLFALFALMPDFDGWDGGQE